MFPLEYRDEVNHEETSHGATLWWKLHDPNFNRFWLIHPCDRRTDRRTDDNILHAIAYMLLRAKNMNDNI